MLLALGAVSGALSAIEALTNSKSASSTRASGGSQGATNPFAIDSRDSISPASTASVNAGNSLQISPETMNALFAAQSQGANPTSGAGDTSGASSISSRREAALKDLFSQIDADGDGKITKSEFEGALGAGGTNLAQADDVFAKMDANSDGGINLDEMSKALKSGHRGHGAAQASGNGAESDSPAPRGSTTTTTTAADGSTTTTVTYADGFKMSTTVPGATRSSASSAYDLFAQLMQRQGGQGQGSSTAAGSSMSMSV